jgi:hypothetical protein
MYKKKNKALVPVIIFVVVLGLSIGALILVQNLRKAEIENPGEYATQDDIPRLTVEEAYQAVMDGEAVLVDTRSASQFEAQHAAGAINIPLDEIDARLVELDKNTWYITYCT